MQLRYRVAAGNGLEENPSVEPLIHFIHDRYPADERTVMLGAPGGAGGGGGGGRRVAGRARPASSGDEAAGAMPIVHVILPADFRGLPATTTHVPSYTWDDIGAGLDGIAIDLPALNVKPTHGEFVAMNMEVRDPVWPMRDMLTFTFSVKPGNRTRCGWIRGTVFFRMTRASSSPSLRPARSSMRICSTVHPCGSSSSRIRMRCQSMLRTGWQRCATIFPT